MTSHTQAAQWSVLVAYWVCAVDGLLPKRCTELLNNEHEHGLTLGCQRLHEMPSALLGGHGSDYKLCLQESTDLQIVAAFERHVDMIHRVLDALDN